jgi:hypothetical protein
MRNILVMVLVMVSLLPACAAAQLPPAEPPAVRVGSSALFVELPFEELVDLSDWIITGTVTGQENKWDASHTNINTLVTIAVSEWVKGKPFSTSSEGKQSSDPLSPGHNDNVVITVPGGRVGDVAQWVEDTPVFSNGEQVLLLLQPSPEGTVEVVSGIQGKFTIVNGNAVPAISSSGSVPLAGLISRIKAQLAE